MALSLWSKVRAFFVRKSITRSRPVMNGTKASSMKTLVVQEDKTLKLEDRPLPALGPTDILLRVLAIGQNPTDWKHANYISQPGDMIGCDFVGQVADIGSDVPSAAVRLGQVRWGFVRGGVSRGTGAFAEYVASEWDLTSELPSNISPTQGASLPIPLVTAIQALYLYLKLPEPTPSPSAQVRGKWVLIWSGATSVGQFAIQLAKLSGFNVATTASPRRWDLLKSLGADVVEDYNDPEVAAKLRAATGDGIEFGLDCISESPSCITAQQAFGSQGGKLMMLLSPQDDLPRPEVKTDWLLAYTALGKDVQMGPYQFKSPPEHRQLHVRWMKMCPEFLREGKIKPLEVHVQGGLEDVQKGFEVMQSGQHPGKLVYKVGEMK